MSRSLVVKLTTGAQESLERLAQGLNVAAIAAAAGTPVSLWLAGEATALALPGYAESLHLPHAAPFETLRDTVLTAGTITVCTQCAARRELTEADLIAGIRIAGAAAFVEESLADGAQALVY